MPKTFVTSQLFLCVPHLELHQHRDINIILFLQHQLLVRSLNPVEAGELIWINNRNKFDNQLL